MVEMFKLVFVNEELLFLIDNPLTEFVEISTGAVYPILLGKIWGRLILLSLCVWKIVFHLMGMYSCL